VVNSSNPLKHPALTVREFGLRPQTESLMRTFDQSYGLSPRNVAELPSLNPPYRMTIGKPDGEIEAVHVVRVAQGGMARVYIAVRENEEGQLEVYVTKKMREEAASTSALLRARVEAYNWQRLSGHPHVLRLDGIWWNGVTPALSLEYAPASLRDELNERGKLEISETVEVGLSVLSALNHATSVSSDFAHGDIKPENIMITTDGICKLSDFGLAFVRAEAAPAVDRPRGGTPTYMAPENSDTGISSIAADVYALGAVMLEMLVGRGIDHLPKRRFAQRKQTYYGRRLRSLKRGLPHGLVDFVGECLSSAPERRPTLDDAYARLVELARSLGVAWAEPGDAELVSEQFDPRVQLAVDLNVLRFPGDALVALEPVLSDLPDDTNERVRTFIIATELYMRRGDCERAGETLRLAEQLAVGTPYAGWRVHRLSAMFERTCRKDYDAALRHLTEAVASGPNSYEVWYDRGRYLGEMGRLEEAIASLERAAELNGNLVIYQDLILYLIDLGRERDALAWAERAIELEPYSGWARSLRCFPFVVNKSVPVDYLRQFRADLEYALGDPLTPSNIADMLRDARNGLDQALQARVGSGNSLDGG
jgi:serine/threonine protein kinase